ncbi:MAG TPA: porin [Magnetovibrio sp.]
MKKILLGTTAVVALATMSTEAFAADKISLGLGGFMRQYVGVTNSDEVANAGTNNTDRAMNLSQWSNTEVHFKGSTTLDNGLAVSVKIEKEADKAGTGTDATELTVSSDAMGALTLGGTPHAGDDFRVGAPNAGNFDWTDTDPWVSVGSTTANAQQAAPVARDITDMGDKSIKVKYVSPSFSGVNVFGSYTAAEGSNTHNARNLARNRTNDGSTLGVAYSGEMSGATISAAAIHARTNGTGEVNNFGLNVGMAGFTVGGAYAEFDGDTAGNTGNYGKAWELGVAYETGPYSVSARYMASDDKGVIATAGKDKDKKYQVAGTYDMGAGVALTATYFHSKFDTEGAARAAADGTVSGLIAGIEVGF